MSNGAATTASGSKRKNPYVGPRAFRPGETLYARDSETRELADMLVAQRIVLLHAPSGAGKTSLIQAGLSPLLARNNFSPTPALRVNMPPPAENGKVRNRYSYSLAFYLLGGRKTAKELANLRLRDLLADVIPRESRRTPILILDQFEEILLVDPTDRENQEAFFEELGQALAETETWALLSMREDYIGGLDRFVRYIPGHLDARYRLDFLDHRSAIEAIQRPAADRDVKFADAAAAELVKDLAKVKIQSPDREKEITVEAPYVHPFQLQVVCNALWRSVRSEKEGPGKFRDIKLNDVKRHADIHGAYQRYYERAVGYVAGLTNADEGGIRRWFETELITPQFFRRQTLTGPDCEGVDPTNILHELEGAYLIRSDTRAQSTWYELSHDQLIDPILANNKSWERPRLRPWQLAAREWDEGGQDPRRLLHDWDLFVAQREADSADLNSVETRFLAESQRVAQERSLVERMSTRLHLAYFIVFMLFLAVLGLTIALVLG